MCFWSPTTARPRAIPPPASESDFASREVERMTGRFALPGAANNRVVGEGSQTAPTKHA